MTLLILLNFIWYILIKTAYSGFQGCNYRAKACWQQDPACILFLITNRTFGRIKRIDNLLAIFMYTSAKTPFRIDKAMKY
jgi:hypothetical protein